MQQMQITVQQVEEANQKAEEREDKTCMIYFDDYSLKHMKRMYESGQSLRQIADSAHCSYNTVRRILIKEGVVMRPKTKRETPYNKHMIINDWNADVDTDRICMVHKITRNGLYQALWRWRKEGLNVKRRQER